jgi:hypothetical protein
MERDLFPPAEFMQEGEPLFDWEEDALSKRQAARGARLAKAAASPAAGDGEAPAFSLWERLRRAI